MEGRTTIVIAHRLNYKKAGKIIFLDQGKVTGEGTHAELMQNHEKYHQFVTTQNLTE